MQAAPKDEQAEFLRYRDQMDRRREVLDSGDAASEHRRGMHPQLVAMSRLSSAQWEKWKLLASED